MNTKITIPESTEHLPLWGTFGFKKAKAYLEQPYRLKRHHDGKKGELYNFYDILYVCIDKESFLVNHGLNQVPFWNQTRSYEKSHELLAFYKPKGWYNSRDLTLVDITNNGELIFRVDMGIALFIYETRE